MDHEPEWLRFERMKRAILRDALEVLAINYTGTLLPSIRIYEPTYSKRTEVPADVDRSTSPTP